MSTTTKTPPIKPFDYKAASTAILRTLKRDRDRQIIAKRFGFGLTKRQTLEKIGRSFGITRERVRQIEKATLIKIQSQPGAEVSQANQLFSTYLDAQGGLSLTSEIAAKMGATTPEEESYVVFLATLAPDIAVIDDDDRFRASLGLLPTYNAAMVEQLAAELILAITTVSQPVALDQVYKHLSEPLPKPLLENVAKISKQLATFDGRWGLVSWPEVNPRSIRDKTYLVLNKHGQPLHFTEIFNHIRNSDFHRREVTVQAVHNELIKDPRFILIGRGIYALSQWGYTPGTVADIIVDILKAESPLHKDEIIKRVLKKRQVKTTTIILNLQEKDHFVRVAKATYKLKDQ